LPAADGRRLACMTRMGATWDVTEATRIFDMHSVVMMSALAVTSGLFGVGRASCPSGQCGGAAVAPMASYQYAAPAPSFTQVQSLPSTPIAYSPVQGYEYTPTVYYAATYVYQPAYQQPGTSSGGAFTIIPAAMPSQVVYYAYPPLLAYPGASWSQR
jgi:hypothetical protein